MEESNIQSDELTEYQRERRERRKRAVKLLKDRGIWDRLLDGKHTLRHIYSGLIEETYLELDEESASLKETGKDYEAMDLPYVAFVLYPGIGAFDDWFEEGSEEYKALEVLVDW